MPLVCRNVPNRSEASKWKRRISPNDVARWARYASEHGFSDTEILLAVESKLESDYVLVRRLTQDDRICVQGFSSFLEAIDYALDVITLGGVQRLLAGIKHPLARVLSEALKLFTLAVVGTRACNQRILTILNQLVGVNYG